jgi:hypothetical protein
VGRNIKITILKAGVVWADGNLLVYKTYGTRNHYLVSPEKLQN